MLDKDLIFGNDKTVDFAKMAKSCEISLTAKLKPQPVCISMGEHNFGTQTQATVFGSYGDYSCLVGASKSKKSFLKSAICSSFFGGNSNHYFDDWKGHQTQGKWLIDIDTEQSDYHAWRVFRRIPEMVGSYDIQYKGFALRRYTPRERMDFIEWLVYDSEYRGKIGLISIDGYADLISDFNDLEQSNELTSNLMKWSHDAECHITGVLHKNFGTEKPVGHIGSAVLKKAETVAFVVPETDENGKPLWAAPVKVDCRYARNVPFDEFSFVIDPNHLPKKSETWI